MAINSYSVDGRQLSPLVDVSLPISHDSQALRLFKGNV